MRQNAVEVEGHGISTCDSHELPAATPFAIVGTMVQRKQKTNVVETCTCSYRNLGILCYDETRQALLFVNAYQTTTHPVLEVSTKFRT